MTKCGNFLCFLVQLRLKITKLTPIFVRLKATTKIKTMTWRKPYPQFKYQVLISKRVSNSLYSSHNHQYGALSKIAFGNVAILLPN